MCNARRWVIHIKQQKLISSPQLPSADFLPQSTAEMQILPVLKTNDRHVEILPRFWFWSYDRHRHTILHQPTKFHSNHIVQSGVTTSHRMMAIPSQIYFRFRIWWHHSFKKVEICFQSKFRRYIWIHGWDFTTSGFWKERASILDLYFRLRLWLFHRQRRVILHLPTKFYPNWTIIGEL